MLQNFPLKLITNVDTDEEETKTSRQLPVPNQEEPHLPFAVNSARTLTSGRLWHRKQQKTGNDLVTSGLVCLLSVNGETPGPTNALTG